MDDLISREAALEAVKIPDSGCVNSSERHGIIFARVEARRVIQSIPSVPAVPLEPLCRYLEVYARTPIYNMRHTAEWWKEELEKEKWENWTVEQNA